VTDDAFIVIIKEEASFDVLVIPILMRNTVKGDGLILFQMR
jgi:hypothetical protein